jgi:hypothetical protein
LKDKNLEIVAGAYPFFIDRSEAGTEGVLIRALNRYGTKEMATDFLNCGNGKLEQAGRAWAERHGYSIVSGAGVGPRWRNSR